MEVYMSDELVFGQSLFGYTTLVRDGDTFVALKGEAERDQRIGMRVVLLGDSRGYVPSGFDHGQEVSIVGFTEPFKDGESDHIIRVSDGKRSGWVKPSNIQRSINELPRGTVQDRRHRELRSRVHPGAAELLDAVYLEMDEAERASLPSDLGQYVDSIVGFALNRSQNFGDRLAESVARVYAESPGGERFIKDPIRSNAIVDARLFLDRDGELISLKNAEVVWDTSIPPQLSIKRYESYEVLTGPLSGKRYSWQEAGQLGDPVYKPGRATAVRQAERTVTQPLKVFLCHSSADKDFVRRLHADLRRDGLQPWLDAEDLIPGQEWKVAIERAVRSSDVVLVCLSQSSISKTGFVQKEITFALDAAEERPEGAIYIVPARLETCEVPQRLGKWQWVDLFEPNGYQKLLNALTKSRSPIP
jgi:TIR domain